MESTRPSENTSLRTFSDHSQQDSFLKRILSLQGEVNKDYFCLLCKDVFLNKHQLVQHYWKNHSDVIQESVFDKGLLDSTNFRCEICKEEFINNTSLNNHVSRHFTINKPNQVLGCWKRMATNNSIRCGLCLEMFDDLISLDDHVKSHHNVTVSYLIEAAIEETVPQPQVNSPPSEYVLTNQGSSQQQEYLDNCEQDSDEVIVCGKHFSDDIILGHHKVPKHSKNKLNSTSKTNSSKHKLCAKSNFMAPTGSTNESKTVSINLPTCSDNLKSFQLSSSKSNVEDAPEETVPLETYRTTYFKSITKSFDCVICHKHFNQEKLLLDHQLANHKHPYSCETCRRGFSKLHLLEYHKLFDHLHCKKKSLLISNLNNVDNTENILVESDIEMVPIHQIINESQNNHVEHSDICESGDRRCNEVIVPPKESNSKEINCSKSQQQQTPNLSSLRETSILPLVTVDDRHVINKECSELIVSPISFSCNICELTFEDLPEMIRHKETIHAMIDQSENNMFFPIENVICNRTLTQDMTSPHHQNSFFKCSKCSLGFQYFYQLTLHSELCGIDNRLKCEYCGKLFSDLTLKNHHVKSCHTPPTVRYKAWTCKLCWKVFVRKHMLHHHMKYFHNMSSLRKISQATLKSTKKSMFGDLICEYDCNGNDKINQNQLKDNNMKSSSSGINHLQTEEVKLPAADRSLSNSRVVIGQEKNRSTQSMTSSSIELSPPFVSGCDIRVKEEPPTESKETICNVTNHEDTIAVINTINHKQLSVNVKIGEQNNSKSQTSDYPNLIPIRIDAGTANRSSNIENHFTMKSSSESTSTNYNKNNSTSVVQHKLLPVSKSIMVSAPCIGNQTEEQDSLFKGSPSIKVNKNATPVEILTSTDQNTSRRLKPRNEIKLRSPFTSTRMSDSVKQKKNLDKDSSKVTLKKSLIGVKPAYQWKEATNPFIKENNPKTYVGFSFKKRSAERATKQPQQMLADNRRLEAPRSKRFKTEACDMPTESNHLHLEQTLMVQCNPEHLVMNFVPENFELFKH